MFQKILVPLDGSPFGEGAIGPALDLARRSAGEVRFVAVQEIVTLPAPEMWIEPSAWAEPYLLDVRARTEAEGVRVTTVVRDGFPGGQIRAAAEAWGADLIVMTTHGRGPLSRAWLGSVSDHCLRHASRPVLLVRSDPGGTIPGDAPESEGPQSGDASESGGPESGETPETPAYRGLAVERVVVPLDGSKTAEAVLEHGAELARLLDAPLLLLRAVAWPVGALSPYLPDTIQGSEEILRRARDSAEGYLAEVAERLEVEGVTARTEVIVDSRPGHPARTIVEAGHGGLVVMATHGRGGLGRALLGSVADKVVRSADGPVLVLKPDTRRDAGASEPGREER